MSTYAINLQLSWKRSTLPPRRHDSHWYNPKLSRRVRPSWHPNFPKPKV